MFFNQFLSTELENKISNLKLIITDIDGILTDGKILYSNDGQISKQFCIYDGILIKPVIEKYDLCFLAVTGRDDNINSLRLLPLGYEDVRYSRTKLEEINKISREYNVSLNEILYVGDDINDIEALRNVGVSMTCSSAPQYIQNEVDIITQTKSGQGVLREILEMIIFVNGDDILEIF